ncbi:MAG TPA: hypothetical protein VFA20_10940 [Myxococcaceae bacterium]|nr:hypothetical protein [Myxococcaceae bacterium]
MSGGAVKGALTGVLMLCACTGRSPAAPPDGSLAVARALSVRLTPEGATAVDDVTEVVAEVLVRGGTRAQPLSVDFVAPSGATFQRSTAEVAAGEGRLLSFSMPVAGTDAARFPGAWSAVLNGPRGPLASADFQLQGWSLGAPDTPAAPVESPAFQARPGPSFDVTSFPDDDGTNALVAPASTTPDVVALTARTIPGLIQLNWTNPAQHDGVLILRAIGAPPNTAPTDHFAYLPQQLIGNARVLVATSSTSLNTYTDSGLANDTRYYYRVYNHFNNLTYASGNVPPGGIWGEPKARTGANPLWCYSTGFPNLLQPVTDLGVAVYSAGNLGAVTGNVTDTANVNNDGLEKFRPVSVGAPVQSRFLVVPLAGHAGANYAVVGDQGGRVTAVNSATGAVLWVANGGVTLGDRVQGQPIIQFASRANAAYLAVHAGRDLIFVGTRNTTAPNKVYALSSVNGSVVWTYAPGDLGMVNGGFMVDYEFNRLFVAARGTGSLRVLSSITGGEITRLNLGDIDSGVVRDQGFSGLTSDDSAEVINTSGTVTAVDVINLVPRWSVTPGASSTFVTPTGTGFIISLNSGAVQRWLISGMGGMGGAPNLMWSAAVPGPSGVRIDFVRQKIFAGGSDGRLYEMDTVTGAARSFPVDLGQGVGTPTIDTVVNRLHVGSLDGRLCAFSLPFP